MLINMAAEWNVNVNNFIQIIVKYTAFREQLNQSWRLLIKNNNAYCFGQNPGAQGEYPIMQVLWATAWLLVTRVTPIYLVDEFFLLLV